MKHHLGWTSTGAWNQKYHPGLGFSSPEATCYPINGGRENIITWWISSHVWLPEANWKRPEFQTRRWNRFTNTIGCWPAVIPHGFSKQTFDIPAFPTYVPKYTKDLEKTSCHNPTYWSSKLPFPQLSHMDPENTKVLNGKKNFDTAQLMEGSMLVGGR